MRKYAGLLGLVLVAGCPSERKPFPLQPLTLPSAIGIVNRNLDRVTGGLKATGSVRGQVMDSGGMRRHFELTGKLLLIPPRHLRFDVQNAFGRTELLLGSNDEHFWLCIGRDEDTFRFGRYDTPEEQRGLALPIRPDWMIEALGLSRLPEDATGRYGPMQLVEEDHQQLLFISYDDDDRGMIRKEYWLSRYAPRLVQRVVFRDSLGVVQMTSRLGDYRAERPDGPLFPHEMRVEWAGGAHWIAFEIRRWREIPELTVDHPAFQLPPLETLRETYRHVIDIDQAGGDDRPES